ncbi:MAG: FtsX-like permease family protein [Acidihalobacter sp.]
MKASGRSLIARAGLRYWLRNPVQLVLALTGIALGVAVVVAVALANASALKGFEASTRALDGAANARVVAGPQGIDEAFYVRLRVHDGITRSAPVVEGYARVGGRTLRLVGIDPFAQATLAPGLFGGGAGLAALMTSGNGVLMTPATASGLGLTGNGVFTAQIDGRQRRLRLLGAPGGDAAALRGMLITDIGTAQDLLGRLGRLSRIDLALSPAQMAHVRSLLPPGARLVPVAAKLADAARVTRAFRLNLLAMSGLALLIGAYLIYNTLVFSVLRRRHLVSLLRAQGVTRGEIVRGILGEASVLALLGALLGLGLGVLLGRGLVRLVTRTINDLYFTLTVDHLFLSPWVLAEGFALALLMVLVAAAPPAREAAGLPPRGRGLPMSLEATARRREPWRMLGGTLLLGLSAGVLLWPGGGLFGAFAGLFLGVIGASLWIPAWVRLVLWLLGKATARAGVGMRLAVGGVRASLGRTVVAVAALSVALAASIGVGIMVDSFRATLVDWLTQSLRGDIYVNAQSGPGGRGLAPGFVAAVKGLPEVARVTEGRHARIDGPDGPVALLALGEAAGHHPNAVLKRAGPGVWTAFAAGRAVLVSEPLASRLHLKPGGEIALNTAQGRHRFRVGGVFYDYGGGSGLVMLARGLYEKFWNDSAVGSLAVYLRPGTSLDAALATIRAHAGAAGVDVSVRANGAIVAKSLQVFDRTFAITRVLRVLLLAVAMVGVLASLMALHLERSREHATLRAQGVTPFGLFALIGGQSALLGLLAGLAALPLGLGMAWVLTEVVNPRAFGWTLQWHSQPALLLEALAAAVVAALLAALWPAWRMTRTPPARALREE